MNRYLRNCAVIFVIILLAVSGCEKSSERATSKKKDKSISVSDGTVVDNLDESAENDDEKASQDISESDEIIVDESDEDVENVTENITETTEKEVHILKKYTRNYSSSGAYTGGYEIDYDESGNKTIVKKFDRNNNEEERTEYEYDVNGNALKENRFNSHGELYEYTEWEYDSAGNRIKRRTYNVIVEEVRELQTWDYDSNGNRIKEYGDDGLLRTEWEYDDSGKISKMIEFTYIKGGIISEDVWAYEYDPDGNLIKKEKYMEDGTVSETYTWEYDSNGHSVVEDWSSLYARYRDESEYDAMGGITQRIRYSEKGGTILSIDKWEYEYDDKGNVTYVKTDFDGDIHWSEYEYVYSE